MMKSGTKCAYITVVALTSHVAAAVAACLGAPVSNCRAIARSCGRARSFAWIRRAGTAQRFARPYIHVEDLYVYVAICCNIFV